MFQLLRCIQSYSGIIKHIQELFRHTQGNTDFLKTLISYDKNFTLLLACFGSILTRLLNILHLYFSHYVSSIFSHNARGESSTGAGIFTNISHSNSYIGEKIKVYQNYSKYVNAICTTCITINYLFMDKTEKFVVLSARR